MCITTSYNSIGILLNKTYLIIYRKLFLWGSRQSRNEKDAHYNSQEKILAYYHTLILILSEHLLLVVFTVEFQD